MKGMIYLSQLINTKIFYQGKFYGKVIDLAVVENQPHVPISKIVIKKNDKKVTIPPNAVTLREGNFIINNPNVPYLPYDENDFYLSEDLLDKQVIDIDGKRLVRVNDVLMESNGEIKVIGIDIGFSGILRRLGVDWLFKMKPKTLPWAVIEAFDYQTGAVRLKLTHNKLEAFHPSEIADILEILGRKERLGIFEILDAQHAAAAIEESNIETQVSILEQLSLTSLKKIISKMLPSQIADVFYKLDSPRSNEIAKLLNQDEIKTVQTLSKFPDDVAGGLMELFFYEMKADITVKEALLELQKHNAKPETIVISNGKEKFVGVVHTKELVNIDPLATLRDEVSDKKFVYPTTRFPVLLRLFSQYNLRTLPVVNQEKKVLGVVTVDTVIKRIEEERERNDVL